jgi:restriction system protein
MGNINFGSGEFTPILSEIVGLRSGLALNEGQIRTHAGAGWDELWRTLQAGRGVRIRSDDFNRLVMAILRNTGASSVVPGLNPFLELVAAARTEEERTLYSSIVSAWSRWMFDELRRRGGPGGPPLNPTHFIDEVLGAHGAEAAGIALKLVDRVGEYQRVDPWSQLHFFDTDEIVSLRDLFVSERLGDDAFIEQQYVDFVAANTDVLNDIHWRKFEALTAEFFAREGYDVEIGPGRGDGGVDVRVFDPEDPSRALTLIQCKRHKKPVPQIVVKGLHADMKWEQVERGMIVTTSRLAPSARDVISVRGYSVEEADRSTVEKWLKALRTPRTPALFGRTE